MAGVKGRSGSGGARPGAGRKPKEKVEEKTIPVEDDGVDMLALLQQIALGQIEVSSTQLRAAIAAVQYTHAKVGEGGKKELKQEQAKKVAGRFSPAEPPKLVASGGKTVQ